MPVYYRETVVDQPPNFDPRGTDPRQSQRLLLQPQLSAGSSLTGTTIVSPSESTYIFGMNDPRDTQSENDGTASFGTWLSASHLGTTPQVTKVPPSQSSPSVSQLRMPSVAMPKGQPRQQQQSSHAQHFPLEVRVPPAAAERTVGGPGTDAPGEVSRRTERWSREEFYPGQENGRVPGAPFHKVTKEDYVIEQVVESTPQLVHTTRIVYPTQQQQPLLGVQPQAQQQMPKQQPQQQRQPVQLQQQVPKQYYQVQQQQQPPKQSQPYEESTQKQQQQQQRQLPQVPSKAPKVPQAVQQPLHSPQQNQQRQQAQNVPQTQQKAQNYAQQHQYVQQQVHQQLQQQHELPQHAVQREQHVVQQQSLQQQQPQQQHQGVQIQQMQTVQMEQQRNKEQQQKRVQPQPQQHLLQYVQQKEQQTGKESLLQRAAQQDQAVAEEQQRPKINGQATQQVQLQQQQQKLRQWEQFEHQEQAVQQRQKQQQLHKEQQQYQQNVQQQQRQKDTAWKQQQQFEAEESEAVKQKQRSAQGERRISETEEGAEDAPPPHMQLAEAPEELIERQTSVDRAGDGSASPERQTHRRHVMQNSPWYRQHPDFEQQKYQDFRNFAEPLYVCSDLPTDGFPFPCHKSPHSFHYLHFQPQQRVHQYFSPSSVKWDSIYEDEFPDGQPPPFAHGPGSPYDYVAYHQKVNLDRRRAESEQRRRHHSPVPGAAEHGYKFGGMDFVDHIGFDPHSYVGEPYDERQSRRDLHTGPPRRRGDFYGLDYTTMLAEDGQQPHEWAAEEAHNYHGYQALPPRKNFRLCGRYTADPDAPLNITEAVGLDELDSEYMVGNTLSNQRCVPDRQLTDEEKRTFALLYGPGGFKPDHVTIRPDPVPDEPPVFSTTIGPQKSRSAADISPTPQGYVNPMKVEGESWMLGRRSEQNNNYGLLASSGEQPPFVRPARFPPHVPQWAKERQFAMTRAAKSVDRSLFAPSWAKVPQPHPPYWVKRTDRAKGVGAVQAKQQQGERKSEEEPGEQWDDGMGQQRVEAVQEQQQSQQQQRQPMESQQQMGQRVQQQQRQQAVGKSQQQHLVEQQQQQKQKQQRDQTVQQPQNYLNLQRQQQQQVQQFHQQPQFRAVQQKAALPQQQQQQQIGQFQKETQKMKIITTEAITIEQQDNQPTQEVGPVQQGTEQRQKSFQQQQQIATPTAGKANSKSTTTATTMTTTSRVLKDGTPHAQWQQQQLRQPQQQQQQPVKQVQAVQHHFEQMPAQQQQFNQPGGMYYFYDKRTDVVGQKAAQQPQQKMELQTERPGVAMAQQRRMPSAEESSGLENLMVPKLDQFPALPEGGGGKQFTGQQQVVRSGRNAVQQAVPKEEVQKGVRAVQQQQQQWPQFLTGRRWSQEPQEGDVFVDGHGRPVHYVHEVEVDPHTGEAVTREQWQMVDEYRGHQAEEKEQGLNGNALSANTSRQFRQQITAKSSTESGVKQ